jgi:glycosyltransferase involved in cell wall biosynthesis
MNSNQHNSKPARQTASHSEVAGVSVAVLTGGADRPYAYGLATALMAKGVKLDLVANDELECPEFHDQRSVNFLNLRGEQQPDASFIRKALRVSIYYAKLLHYAATAKPKVFHILWNNRFDLFDRTFLMVYYRLLGKKILLTLHNVNSGTRDSNDTAFNRFTLRTQYRLANHLFVHTEKMRLELMEQFNVPEERITVIPFGINNSVPNTDLTTDAARKQLGLGKSEKVILFYGCIAPYKGLEYLVSAFSKISGSDDTYRLIIAGRPKNCESYWTEIETFIEPYVQNGSVIVRPEFIPDEETEIYFKAADVVVLPYTHIYQSGVLFLGYSFGLPVIASDVGSLKDDIVQGKTGFICEPRNPDHLAQVIERYFSSDLYQNLSERRGEIANYANQRNSWGVVAEVTVKTYEDVLYSGQVNQVVPSPESSASFEMKTP